MCETRVRRRRHILFLPSLPASSAGYADRIPQAFLVEYLSRFQEGTMHLSCRIQHGHRMLRGFTSPPQGLLSFLRYLEVVCLGQSIFPIFDRTLRRGTRCSSAVRTGEVCSEWALEYESCPSYCKKEYELVRNVGEMTEQVVSNCGSLRVSRAWLKPLRLGRRHNAQSARPLSTNLIAIKI